MKLVRAASPGLIVAMVVAIVVAMVAPSTASARPWTWKEPGEFLHDLAAAPDGSIATFAGRRLLRFSKAGKKLQDRSFGPRSVVTAITFAPDGDLLATGYFEGALDVGKRLVAQDRDGFVVRYRPDGGLRWVVHATSDWNVSFYGVAAGTDRVVAVGRTQGKTTIGTRALEGDTGLQLVLDGKTGAVAALEQVPLGQEGELVGACALPDGFVVTGRDRPEAGDRGIVRRISRDGAVRWTYAPPAPASKVACRADGTSFVATAGQGQPPAGNDSDDLWIHQLDRDGKRVRTLEVITPEDDNVLSLSAGATELVVTSQHRQPDDRGMASRVTRFGADGKRLGAETYAGDDSIYVRAVVRGRGLVLAGEVQRDASTTIAGTRLAGPVLFVLAR